MKRGGQTEQGRERRYSIDELAQRAGTTSRNIRAFQTLGVLAKPEMSGRRGSYGQDHLQRLHAILRLQRVGFSLAAIRALFDAWARGLSLEEILGTGGRPTPSDVEALYPFSEWRPTRLGELISVLPSAMLADEQSPQLTSSRS